MVIESGSWVRNVTIKIFGDIALSHIWLAQTELAPHCWYPVPSKAYEARRNRIEQNWRYDVEWHCHVILVADIQQSFLQANNQTVKLINHVHQCFHSPISAQALRLRRLSRHEEEIDDGQSLQKWQNIYIFVKDRHCRLLLPHVLCLGLVSAFFNSGLHH